MFRESLKSIPVIWKCAKIPACLKILQSIFTAVLMPVSIYLTQLLIDNIELYINGIVNAAHIFGIFVLVLLSAVFLAGTAFIHNLILISLQRGINQNLTTIIVNKFLAIEYACFEDKNVADLLKRMGDAPQNNILNVFLNTLNGMTNAVAILGTIIVFSQVSVYFSALFFVILIPMFWLDFKAVNMMNIMFNSQTGQERELNYLSSLLTDKNSLFELKIFGAIQYIANKWKALNKKVLDERVKTTICCQKYFAISTGLIILWTGFVVAVLIWRIRDQAISIGVFVSVIGSIGTIWGLSETLSRTISMLAQEHLVMKHYEKFLALPITDHENREVDWISPHIVFENVHFTYPNTDIEVLKGVSMEFQADRRASIVGENGAGKSTIVKLLCKLYRPSDGKITINGIDINDIPTGQLKKLYSVVFQDYASYSLTLRENIAFGDISKISDDSALLKAMRQGLANKVLENLHYGLDSNLGKIEEDGVELSGGQWQRIAISRACLSDGTFVILDEPTASLDPIAEAEMYRSFASLLSQKGCILISHRLASARLADMIYVLKDGVITEKGTHEELMSQKGLYESMFSSQSSWYHEQRVEGNGR